MAVQCAAEAADAIKVSSLKTRLALAAVTLVSTTPVVADDDWSTDVSYLSYSESDGRVNVSKALWDITRANDDNKTSVQLIFDTMSGASPTGAIKGAEGSVTTVTGASGGAGLEASGSNESTATVFSDTRVQIAAQQQWQLNRLHALDVGAVYSTEDDYESTGASIGLKRESPNKNTSYTVAIARTFDSIRTSYDDSTPAPLTSTNSRRRFSVGQRSTTDLGLGVTQVLNRQTLAQFNVSFTQSNGYHTDPYKVISVADANDRVLDNYSESRPDSRTRGSAYAKVIHQIDNTKHAIHLGYRLYRDDWGVRSNTVDAHYHFQLNAKSYIEPHIRFYQQSAADFYQHKLDVDSNSDVIIPQSGFASADYRLDRMNSVTLGAKYGIALSPAIKLRFRAAYLQQAFSTATFETNTAVIVQTSFSYTF